jgi:hypothetical protein
MQHEVPAPDSVPPVNNPDPEPGDGKPQAPPTDDRRPSPPVKLPGQQNPPERVAQAGVSRA